jgi:hypothetical protein
MYTILSIITSQENVLFDHFPSFDDINISNKLYVFVY